MKRSGIIHADLNRALSALRHTDLFALTDSGLPAPATVEVVDLGYAYGSPPFLPVLRLVLAEATVEAAWASRDIVKDNPGMHRELEDLVGPELIDHDDLKARVGRCRFVVRTGEATPYSNVLLRAGVPW